MVFWRGWKRRAEDAHPHPPPQGEASFSAVSSLDGSGPEGGRYDLGRSGSKSAYDVDKEVILSVEFATDSVNRWMNLFILLFCKPAVLALYIVLTVMTLGKGVGGLVENDFLMVLNTVTASFCLLGLLCVFCLYNVMSLRAITSGRRWNRVRARVAAAVHAELAMQSVNVIAYLVPNVYWIANGECRLFSYVIRGAAYAQFTMWLGVFVLLTVTAHQLLPLRPGSRRVPGAPLYSWYMRRKGLRIPRHVHTLLEYTLWVHAEKVVFLWLPGQIIITLQFLYSLGRLGGESLVPGCTAGGNCADLKPPDGMTCTDWIRGPLDNHCSTKSVGNAMAVFSSLIISWIILLLIIGLLYIARTIVELARHSYQQHRAANMMVRIHGQRRISLLVTFIACSVTFWFVHFGSCSSYLATFLGYAPMQLLMSLQAITSALMLLPMAPDARMVALHIWLQDFAWAEVELPTALAARPALYKEEPMFCFETALKALYFSRLVYYYDGTAKINNTEVLGKGEPGIKLTVGTGLAMYNLDSHEAIVEPVQDLTCMVAYSRASRTIVLSFRGTASMANVWLDLQVWRVAHPPGIGSVLHNTQPLVHAGFHACWKERGFGDAVMKRVHELTGIHDDVDEEEAHGHLAAAIARDTGLLRHSAQGSAVPFSSLSPTPAPSFARHSQKSIRDSIILEEEDLVPAVDPELLSTLSFNAGRASMSLEDALATQPSSNPIGNGPSDKLPPEQGLDGVGGADTPRVIRTPSQVRRSPEFPGGCGRAAGDGSPGTQLEGSNGEKPSPAAAASDGKTGEGPWRVLCVGHSLGGALACLAAMDIAMLAQRTARRRGIPRAADVLSVSSYTYGCPRLGNHAAAKLYARVVPDGWDVVHHNDAVARNGKFLRLYKRAGKRVVVSPTGDMIVRPSLAEITVLRGHSSISAHLLASYGRSMGAVLRLSMTRPDNDRALKGIVALSAAPYATQILESGDTVLEPGLVQRILSLREEIEEDKAMRRALAEGTSTDDIAPAGAEEGGEPREEDPDAAAAAAAERGDATAPETIGTAKPAAEGKSKRWYQCKKLGTLFVPFEGRGKQHPHVIHELVAALWHMSKTALSRSS